MDYGMPKELCRGIKLISDQSIAVLLLHQNFTLSIVALHLNLSLLPKLFFFNDT